MLCVGVYTLDVGAHVGQKRTSDHLELQLVVGILIQKCGEQNETEINKERSIQQGRQNIFVFLREAPIKIGF